MMKPTTRVLLILFVFLSASMVSRSQGWFFRIAPEYNLQDFQYSTPWDKYFEFDSKSSYQFGGDVGYQYGPRSSSLRIRYSVGLQYQFVDLTGKIKDELLDEQYVLNSSFSDSYEILSLPLRLEFLLQPRSYQPLSYAVGLSAAVFINKTINAQSDATMRDGSHRSFDLDTRELLFSGSIGALVDLNLSRNLVFELYGGYHYAFQNLLNTEGASFYLNYTEISARLKFNLYRQK
jgi:hypothetical protein